jgi:cyclopropane fatty-acyl-phospholipid synthase-like methyltransferase
MPPRARRSIRTSARALLVLTGVLVVGCAQREVVPRVVHESVGHEATSSHSFSDAARWATVFDDPGRDEWQKPDEIVAMLEIRPGMAVADLGAGTGYFLSYLSRAAGPHGTVFAVDTESNLVEHMRARIAREGITNVVPVLATPDDAHLAARSVDRILILDTYHHISDRLNYFERLRAALKPDARIAVVDWHKRELPEGPPVDHKLAREQVVDEMRMASYALVGETDRLPYQYMLIFASDAR